MFTVEWNHSFWALEVFTITSLEETSNDPFFTSGFVENSIRFILL